MTAFIGIEMGGTKVIIAHGTGPEDLRPPLRLPTVAPTDTVITIIAAVRQLIDTYGPVAGIGIASFGPIRVSRHDPMYGCFGLTPKPGYSHFDLLTPIAAAIPGVKIMLDTDVNGAALGEGRWGAGQGLDTFAYATVGTGLGIGLIMNGAPAHGLLHPEGGHVLVRRDPAHDPFKGSCPFHGDCAEGLICGPAIEQRTGQRGETLGDDHPVWALSGDYLAQLFQAVTLIASPQRIIVGGSIGLKPSVLAAARAGLNNYLGGYIEALANPGTMDDYIVPAALGDQAGVLGAIALAARMAS